jgi:outer membrane protein OmpA-like peptidoglycan-associated protein
MNKFISLLLTAAALHGLLSEKACAQIRAGSAFLKILPGARVQSMAGASAGVLDDPHAVFANAGAAGFLREWQWAAGYAKWIADITNASFMYARRIPTPISRDTRFALGVLYQGIPDLNNSAGSLPPASAGDLVVALSVGQPFMVKNKTVSIGANIKYLNSTLAQYSAQSIVFDVGMTAKTAQFNVGKKMKGLFGFGTGVSEIGQGLVIDQTSTPLPLSWRSGLSCYLGSPKGLQILFAADYVSVKDRQSYVALGGELLVNRLISLNAGCNFGSDLFKQLTVGAGIRLDDVGTAIGNAFPSRHNAFRLDVASLDGSEYFSRTYQAAASHFPTVPEPFAYISPAEGDSISSAEVVLRWQTAHDRDVFDHVRYRLLVNRDSAGIAHVLDSYENNKELFLSLLNKSMAVNVETDRTFYPIADMPAGAFYWAVCAIDEDQQVRFGHGVSGPIARFHLPSPSIEIKDIQFVNHPIITTDDYQGLIRVTLENTGARTSQQTTVRMEDGIEHLEYSLESLTANDPTMILPEQNSMQQTVAALKPGESATVEFKWATRLQGKHKLRFYVGADAETPAKMPQWEESFFTIPKGSMAMEDTLLTVMSLKKIIDVPLITELTFDAGSAVPKPDYYGPTAQQPVLAILAERLKNNPQKTIQLQGFIDQNSGENDLQLAEQRARSIQQALVEMGAELTQIHILQSRRSPKRLLPTNTENLDWILEERRLVRVTVENGDGAVLLAPIRQVEVDYTGCDTNFNSKIKSTVGMSNVVVNCSVGDYVSRQELPVFDQKRDISTFMWNMKQDEIEKQVNQNVEYALTLTDSLGRQFQTPPFRMHVLENETIAEHIYSIPFQFAKTDPLADLYWKRLTQLVKNVSTEPEMRVRFEGHSCAIGPEAVNRDLSRRRAERFCTEFKHQLKIQDGEMLSKMIERIDQPVGWGESRPLILNAKKQTNADDESAIGRKLNRRIEIVFYKNGRAS